MPTQLAATAWTERIWGRRSRGRSRLHDAGRVDTCTATAEMCAGPLVEHNNEYVSDVATETRRLGSLTAPSWVGWLRMPRRCTGWGLAVLPRDVGQPGDGQYS